MIQYLERLASSAAKHVLLLIAVNSLLTTLAQADESLSLKDQADHAYWDKSFLSAYAIGHEYYPSLEAIDRPRIGLGGLYRYKSGVSGLGRLRIKGLPVLEGVLVNKGIHQFSLRLTRLELSSGALAANAPVGSYPLVPAAYSVTPLSTTDVGIEPVFRYFRDGKRAVFLELGTTPDDAVLSEEVTYRMGLQNQTAHGYWIPEIFSEPVRESVLSYTGILDPYGGAAWGQVSRSGLRFTGYQQLNKQWGSYGQIIAAQYSGTRIKDNQSLGLNLTVGKDFNNGNFNYFSAGPYLSYEQYQKNLSQYSFGHGGYFSPQRFYRLGVSASFLTHEARRSILKGNMILAYQAVFEESSPVFPLAPDGRFYLSSDEDSVGGNIELTGARLYRQNWIIGYALAYRDSPDYHDRIGLIFISYTFGKRNALFSSDIPEYLMRSLY